MSCWPQCFICIVCKCRSQSGFGALALHSTPLSFCLSLCAKRVVSWGQLAQPYSAPRLFEKDDATSAQMVQSLVSSASSSTRVCACTACEMLRKLADPVTGSAPCRWAEYEECAPNLLEIQMVAKLLKCFYCKALHLLLHSHLSWKDSCVCGV
jgi:hypothetical protein